LIRSAAVGATISSVGGAGIAVVEPSLSRTNLGKFDDCGRRTIVGGAVCS
jgi:hypothetical protein